MGGGGVVSTSYGAVVVKEDYGCTAARKHQLLEVDECSKRIKGI